MCSRTVSDTANRLLKRTDNEGSPSVVEEKSSAVPYFRSGRRSLVCAELSNKGKVGVQRGRETAGVPSFLPPRRVPRRSRRPQTANPLAEVQRKTPRPLGANTLTPFVSPAQPVLKRSRPSGANPLAQFVSPAQPVLKKGCRPERANTPAAVRVPQLVSAGNIYKKELLRNATALSSVNLNRTGSKPKFPRRYARSPR